MNRNEERKNASKAYSEAYPIQEYCETEGCCFPNHELTEEIFEEGAIWTDNTMLERIEKWIKLNLEKFVYTSAHSGKGKINPYYVAEALLKDMRQ